MVDHNSIYGKTITKSKSARSFQSACSSLKSALRTYTPTSYIKTGLLAFDGLFAGRGLPTGKIIQFASKPGIGKSIMMLNVSAALCNKGYNVVYIDAEVAVTDSQLEGSGVSKHLDDRFFVFPEQLYEKIDDSIEIFLQHSPALIVIDSITALISRDVLSLNVEEVRPGIDARLQSTLFKKLKGKLADSGTTLIVLNQLRTSLNFKGLSTDKPSGGKALAYYCDATLLLTQVSPIVPKIDLKAPKGTKVKPIGAKCAVDSSKNKLCASSVVPIVLIHGKGVSNLHYIATALITLGYASLNGAWYTVRTLQGEELKFNGETNYHSFIKENLSAYADLVVSKDPSASEGLHASMSEAEGITLDSKDRVGNFFDDPEDIKSPVYEDVVQEDPSFNSDSDDYDLSSEEAQEDLMSAAGVKHINSAELFSNDEPSFSVDSKNQNTSKVKPLFKL